MLLIPDIARVAEKRISSSVGNRVSFSNRLVAAKQGNNAYHCLLGFVDTMGIGDVEDTSVSCIADN
jgi:hypothetical protein